MTRTQAVSPLMPSKSSRQSEFLELIPANEKSVNGPWQGCEARLALWWFMSPSDSSHQELGKGGCHLALVCFALMHVGQVSRTADTDLNSGTPQMALEALHRHSLQGHPDCWCHRSFSVCFLMHIESMGAVLSSNMVWIGCRNTWFICLWRSLNLAVS